VVPKTKTSVIAVLFVCAAMIACNDANTGISTVAVDALDLPDFHGEDISSLISDSGITRYRMQTPIWDVYINDTNPYWYFPEGAYVERFDTMFNVVGFVQSDTAYFYEKPALWHLIGNVKIQNFQGVEFETTEMFWRQNEPPESLNAIYSDSVVVIKRPDDEQIIQGGFRANQSMTEYIFYKHKADIWTEEKPDTTNFQQN